MAILFGKEKTTFKLKNKKHLKNWLKSIVETENKKTGTINIVFCTDEFLLKLNQTYLQHNTYTDIITFPYPTPSSLLISGDIYISIDRVKDNAKYFNVTFLEELCRVMAHGILHLLGYNDKTKNEKTNMRAKEDYCLSLLV